MDTSVQSVPLQDFQQNVAMKSPEHLIRWLNGSGRKWLVFNAEEMVKAQVWPHGIDAFMQIISGYRQHRQAQPSGRVEERKTASGEVVQMSIAKTDVLEVAEMDRAVRWLISQIVEKDPTWSINNPPM